MAGGMLGKFQDAISDTGEKRKRLVGNFAPKTNTKVSISSLNNQTKELLTKKQQLLCYLGLKVYNLYKEGVMESDRLQNDYKELEEIDNELDELNKMIEQIETEKRSKNICECGARFSKKDQFCPGCGKKIKNVIICKCGTVLSPGTKFCNNCGTNVSELGQTFDETANGQKTCICGAQIIAGQIMCMECGRMVE